MTNGIGGTVASQLLNSLSDMTGNVEAIDTGEYRERIVKSRRLMEQRSLAAIYLGAGTNLYYFTGTRWPTLFMGRPCTFVRAQKKGGFYTAPLYSPMLVGSSYH